MVDHPARGLGERVAGRARYLYAAGVLALTEPGPAAAGVVVADQDDRALAHRAQYVGTVSRAEAAAEALLLGLRLAEASELKDLVIRVDERALVQVLGGDPATLPSPVARLAPALREAASQLENYRVELIGAAANPARAVALAPLIDWLPQRARRAEELQVRRLADDSYEVQSASQPDQRYRVHLRPTSTASGSQSVSCECADFEYRGIPCKHILAAAREANLLDRLFYPPPVDPGAV